MDIKINDCGNSRTLSLRGRLDTNSAPELEGPLGEALGHFQDVRLDLAELDYISSAGLRVLLIAQKAADASGHHLAVCNVGADVREVLELTDFISVLNLC